jgi:type VI secretion system secreted protein Hcp
MAQDLFLKIDGIKGESLDDKHKDEIEVLRWSWEILQPSTMHSGSGGGAGKATVRDLKILHCIDCASPNLMKYALTGKHIPSAFLVARKAGGAPHEYIKISMFDVIIARVSMAVGVDDSSLGYESVSLSFSKIKQEYFIQNAQGGNGGAITAGYDIKANKEA